MLTYQSIHWTWAALLFAAITSGIATAQTFTTITEGAIVADSGDSWGPAWGDYDNDGFIDLFVGNVPANGSANNFLYRNRGDGSF